MVDLVDSPIVKWQQGENPRSCTFDAADRIVTMLQKTDLSTYTFDDSGNQTVVNTAGISTTYTYEKENRETNVNANGIRKWSAMIRTPN